MGIDQGGLHSPSASSCFVVIMSDSDSGSNLFAALIQDSILQYVVIQKHKSTYNRLHFLFIYFIFFDRFRLTPVFSGMMNKFHTEVFYTLQ